MIIFLNDFLLQEHKLNCRCKPGVSAPPPGPSLSTNLVGGKDLGEV